MTEALKLFFSYSHKDEDLRDELGSHLRILEHQRLISSWHDRKIMAGDLWDHQITINQDTADIILLLISSDFIASRYCWDIEITRAMELHESGKACVIPVILRSADWTNAPFSRLQAVPKNAQPINSFPDRDTALSSVTQQIRQVATELIEKRRLHRKEANLAAYRQQFQVFASDREVSLGERFILKDLQRKRGLTDLEVQEVEQATFNLATHQENLDSYRQLFLEAIEQYSYPFSEKVRRDLNLVQTHLRLSDVEVAEVEESIVTQQRAEQSKQLPSNGAIASEPEVLEPSLKSQLKSEQPDRASSNSKRKPNRSYQELKEIAISNQVEELFSYLIDELTPHFFWAGTNRNSVTFSSKNNRKVLLSFNPVDSNADKGLKFQMYAERLAEHLTTDVENLIAILPNYKIAWETEWSGTVYEGFFKTLGEAKRFLAILSES